MFREVADIQTAETLNLPVPKANFHNVVVEPSEMQMDMIAELAERAEKVRKGELFPPDKKKAAGSAILAECKAMTNPDPIRCPFFRKTGGKGA